MFNILLFQYIIAKEMMQISSLTAKLASVLGILLTLNHIGFGKQEPSQQHLLLVYFGLTKMVFFSIFMQKERRLT
jgi:hypothetical protein